MNKIGLISVVSATFSGICVLHALEKLSDSPLAWAAAATFGLWAISAAVIAAGADIADAIKSQKSE